VTEFQHYQLIHLQAELQALISEREAMIACNRWRQSCGDSDAYGEDAFAANAAAMRSLVPDPSKLA
jgi:hypothetical protein